MENKIKLNIEQDDLKETTEDKLGLIDYYQIDVENNLVEDSKINIVSELIEQHSAVMLIIDPALDGKIIYANKAAANFYGYCNEELQTMKITDINALSAQEVKLEMENAKKFERNYFHFIHKLKSGELRNVEVYSSPIEINGRKLLYSIIHDITDRKLAENSLKKANSDLINSNNIISQQLVKLNSLYNKIQESENRLIKLNSSKDIFFSIIAHDLKSPVSGFLDTLKMLSTNFSQMTIGTIKEYTTALYESAENLYNFLENLLNWSRIQRGNFRFYYNDYCLNDIIRQILKIVDRNAHLKNIKIVNEITDNIYIYSDENMINSIMGNLIFNAVKYTYSGGLIKISCSDYNKRFFLITVEDNGVGIDENLKDEIFKIDKRAIRPGTNNELGTGLGLILTKDFVEKCGGNIWFDSEAGKYTKFHFTIMKSSIINE